MAQPSTEGYNLASTLARTLSMASADLKSSAGELGADTVLVLYQDGPSVELVYSWSRSAGSSPGEEFLDPPRDISAFVTKLSGLGAQGNPLPHQLLALICPQSASFLPFYWQVRRQAVTIAFGFSTPVPSYSRVPERMAERLSLFGLAAWSVREVARLRAELATVSSRLTARKLVERAKSSLQIERGISEEEAYEYIRGTSRRRRITLEQVAQEVLGTVVRGAPGSARSGSAQMPPNILKSTPLHREQG